MEMGMVVIRPGGDAGIADWHLFTIEIAYETNVDALGAYTNLLWLGCGLGAGSPTPVSVSAKHQKRS